MIYTMLILTILIPTIVSIFFYKELNPTVKLFSEFLIFKSVSEIFFIITAIVGMNNIICVHFYTIIELVFMYLFFRSFYPSLKWFFMGLIGFAFFYLWTHFNDFNLLIRVIEAVFITLIVSFGLIKGHLENLAPIAIGLLYYFGFGIVLFYEMQIKSPILLEIAIGHIVLGAFCNALYTYGILDSFDYFSQTKLKSL